MRTILAASACLALLAACSDNGADADNDGTITKEEVVAEAASGGGDITMRAGQWEHTVEFTEIDLPGVPDNMKDMVRQNMGGKVTSTSCMTQEEAEKPDADFFGGEGQDDCTYEEFDRSGNKMKLRMTCDAGNGGTAKVAMDGEFGADRFTLKMDNTVSGGQMGDVKMKGTISGRRLGDCPA